MLLDFIRPLDIGEIGYFKLILRGFLLTSMEVTLLYISYTDENPTSFVYFAFGAFIFASKMRLRPTKTITSNAYTLEEKEDLEERVRDNKELFKVGITGRIFYLLFAIVMTIIFCCSLAYNKLQNDNDVYPFFQIKPEEMKTKYLLVVLIMSWSVFFLDLSCGRSYHWNELMVYEKFNIKTLQTVCEYTLVYLIFSFSQQVKFSIFSLIFFFFVLLTITVFLVSLLRENSKKVSFDRYISFLKWLTLSGMIVIYLKKSYRRFIDMFGKYGIDKDQTGGFGSELKDLIDQFIDKEEKFDRILVIFILSSLRLYFADISNMIDNIKGILEDKKTIEEDSLFVSYFAENILSVMNKKGSDMIRYDRSYRYEYMDMLEEEDNIRDRFDNIFKHVKVQITRLEKWISFSKQTVNSTTNVVLYVITSNIVIILHISLLYLHIYKMKYNMMIILPIIWCMLSLVIVSPSYICNISILLLYTPTCMYIILYQLSNILCNVDSMIYKMIDASNYCSYMKSYPILSDDNNSISQYDNNMMIFNVLIISIIYIVVMIEKKNNIRYVDINIMGRLSWIKIDNSYYNDMIVLYKYIISTIFSNLYIICLIYLLVTIIRTINIFNFICIIFFYIFILNRSYAKRYWLYLLLYLQFILLVRLLHTLNIYTFRLDRETLNMIGMYYGPGDPSKEKEYMIKYWIVLILVSVQYLLFNTKIAIVYERTVLSFNTPIFRTIIHYIHTVLQYIYILYNHTLIYMYHMILVYILIFSERNILNVILMMLEIMFFLYHTYIYDSNKKILYRYWMIILSVMLLFSVLFYITLFCRYTYMRNILYKLLYIEDDDNSIYNKRVKSEMYMKYIFDNYNRLYIDDNSFIKENIKILLSFVCIYRIRNDKDDDDRSIHIQMDSIRYKILSYISHVWKILILMMIIYMNIVYSSILKIVLLIYILYAYYIYTVSCNLVMTKGKIMDIIYRKIHMYYLLFIKSFETRSEYPNIDMDMVSDHYILSNKNFYRCIYNHFNIIVINTSRYIYRYILFLSCVYYTYIFVLHLLSYNNSRYSYLSYTYSSSDIYALYINEQYMMYILICILIVENKIVTTLDNILNMVKIDRSYILDIETCTEELLSHIDLYIEMKKSNTINQIILDNIEYLNHILFRYKKDTRMIDSMARQEVKRKYNSDIINRSFAGNKLDDIADNYRVCILLNESTTYKEKIILYNRIKSIYNHISILYNILIHLQKIGIILLLSTITISPSLYNILIIAYICIIEVNIRSYTYNYSLLYIISSISIIKDVIMINLLNMKVSSRVMNDYNKPDTMIRLILNTDSRCIYICAAYIVCQNILVFITLYILRHIIIGINYIYMKKSDIYWHTTIINNKKKSKKLVIDHNSWSLYEYSIYNMIYNIVYTHPSELYILIIISITMLSGNQTYWMLIFIMIPYILSYFDIKNDRIKMLFRYYFTMMVYLGWFILLIAYPLRIILSRNAFKWTHTRIDISIGCITLINKIYLDMIHNSEYIDMIIKVKNYRKLSSILINYCNTYNMNENKLLDNINIYIRQMDIVECTDKIYSNEDISNIYTDIEDSDDVYDNNVMESINPKMVGWKYLKIWMNRLIYKVLMDMNYNESYESVFYLYTMYKNKNRRVINDKNISINDYLKLNVDILLSNIDDVDRYYSNVMNKRQESINLYNESYNNIQSKISDMILKDRVKNVKNSRDEVYTNEEDNRRVDIDHRSAVNILYDHIYNKQSQYQYNNNIDDNNIFVFNMNKNEDIIFNNIQPNNVKQTHHYTSFNYIVVLNLTIGIFSNNLDKIIIIIITVVHIYNGGLYSVIILTLIFFILVEERPGRYFLWMVIAIIYFIVIFIILILRYFSEYRLRSTDTSNIHMLPNQLTIELVLLFIGKVDSFIMIFILFVLIIVLKMNFMRLGIYNHDIMKIESLPLTVYRIIVNNDYYNMYDVHMDSKKQYVESIEGIVYDHIKHDISNSI